MVQVLDSEDEPDRFLGVHTSSLVIAHIDDSSEEEVKMALNRKKRPEGAHREEEQGASVEGRLKVPSSSCSPPFLLLKKKRKEKEVVCQNEPKQQKMAEGQERASTVKSREDQHVAEV